MNQEIKNKIENKINDIELEIDDLLKYTYQEKLKSSVKLFFTCQIKGKEKEIDFLKDVLINLRCKRPIRCSGEDCDDCKGCDGCEGCDRYNGDIKHNANNDNNKEERWSNEWALGVMAYAHKRIKELKEQEDGKIVTWNNIRNKYYRKGLLMAYESIASWGM